MIDFQSGSGWYKNSFGGVSRWILWGIITPRPAGPYTDISLAGKNPMSVALTERPHESQDNYLLEKMHFYQMIRNTIAYSFIR